MDKDPKRYTAELLVGWKLDHEEIIDKDRKAPPLPTIEMKTMVGLSIPPNSAVQMSWEDVSPLREHRLTIKNTTHRVIRNFESRIQFPEPVAHVRLVSNPIGTMVAYSPDRMEGRFVASGSGSVKYNPSSLALDYKVEIDQLPAGKSIELSFLSVPDEKGLGTTSKSGDLEHHILGDFGFEFLGTDQVRKFYMPLKYDPDKRTITSEPVIDQFQVGKFAVRQILM